LKARPLNANQHAFLKGRSTETALTSMVNKIESALNNQKIAIGVFLDIQGAFDNVKTESIIEGMKAKNIDRKIISWYGSYLQNRTVQIEYKGCKAERSLIKGTPQGGVLSPLMWNLAFESLLALFKDDDPVKINGYADDAALICAGEDSRQIHMYIQRTLNKISEWGLRHNLTFSAAKTVAVVFTKKHKCIKPVLTLNGIAIPYCEDVKYLGVILDSKLTWRKHVKAKINNAKAQILKIRNAMGKLWGAPPKMMKWAFTGIVRPAIMYGALVWAKVSQTAWAEEEFTKINRMALMTFGHLRRSTPTAGLEVSNYLRPLKYQLMLEAAMGYIRTKHIHRGMRSSKHLVFAAQMVNDPIFHEETDEDKLTFNWDKKYHVSKESFQCGEPDLTSNFVIYTDGSLTKGQAGSGFQIISQMDQIVEEGSYALGCDRTVFQAEIFAIYKAVEWLLSNKVTYRRINIHIDSQAALMALSSVHVKKDSVRKVVNMLNELGHKNTVTLRWIKSHKGFQGNERADKLAKLGTSHSQIALDRPLISKNILRNKAKDTVDNIWNSEWNQIKSCRQTKLWFPSINRQNAEQILKLKRTEYSTITQLITGHCYLNRHNSLINPEINPNCQYCQTDNTQTSFHLVAECPRFAQTRQQIFGMHTIQSHQAWKVAKVVQFVREVKLPDGDLLLGNLRDPGSASPRR
jgi:ribonuclease HI